MSRLIVLFALFLNFSNAVAAETILAARPDCAAVKAVAAPGDLIFLASSNYVFQNIARLTASWTSHVGLVFREPGENGEWYMLESTLPRSKRTELCEFLNRTEGARFEVRRYPALTAENVERLRAEAETRLGILYHTGFDYESDRQFCSKFVYDSYMEAMGLEVGKKETFQDLRDAHPEVDLTFAQAWFFGNIPWDRVTVTPASQLVDADLVTVMESF